MGVVYEAHDDQLDRPVAIKVVAAGHATEIGRQRLQREAKAAARLRHPHICQIYDFGETDGDPFIAMELLDGEPLSERLTRGALSVADAVAIALQMLDALQTLHEQGIVHRDLKPSNVFMTAHGAKLLDFGLARSTSTDAGGTERTEGPLTRPGATVGTPHYMSPEQFRGDAVDPRSDLFSTGVMLFEMLSGQRPFSGDTDLSIYHAILYERPAALGGSPAVAIIDGVIRRALAKPREERIQSAADMAAALRLALAAQDSGAPIETRIMTRVMVLPFRMLRPDPDLDFLAVSLPDAISQSLAGLESLVVRSAAAARYSAELPDLKRIAEEAAVDAVLVGSILSAGKQIRVSTQLVTARDGTLVWSDTAQVTLTDVFQLQDDIVTRIVDSLSHQLSASDHRTRQRDVPASPRAYELYLRGNQIIVQGLRGGAELSIARDLYLRCVAEDPRFAPAWARLGRCYWLLAKGAEDGAALFAEADASFQKALTLNPDLSLAHSLYAHLEVELNRATEATIRLLGRIREGRAEPELYAALAHTCRFDGFLEASAAAHELARNLDPDIQTSANQTYYQLGDLARSHKEMGKGTLFVDALILFEEGRRDEAVQLLRERERTNLLPLTRVSLGGIRALMEGRGEEGIALEQRAASRSFDPEIMVYMARLLSMLGAPREALLLWQRALDRGFNPYRMLLRSDPWLDAARSHPDFPRLFTRTREKYESARQAFVEAGGERLLGVTLP